MSSLSQAKGKPCNRNCGTLIHWDDKHVSPSGKKIPLEENGEPHQCPNKLPYDRNNVDPEYGYSRSMVASEETLHYLDISKKLDKILEILNKMTGQESLE